MAVWNPGGKPGNGLVDDGEGSEEEDNDDVKPV